MPFVKKYKFSSEQDRIIRETYEKYYSKGPVVRLSKMGAFVGYPKWQIQDRARLLGVSRRLRPWTVGEDKIVKLMAGNKPPFVIMNQLKVKGYHRSLVAVTARIFDLGLRAKADTFSIQALSVGFRTSDERIRLWISQGKMRALRSGDNGHYNVLPREVAYFIRFHTFELEKCKPDIPWIVSLLDEFPASEFDNDKWRERRDRYFTGDDTDEC